VIPNTTKVNLLELLYIFILEKKFLIYYLSFQKIPSLTKKNKNIKLFIDNKGYSTNYK